MVQRTHREKKYILISNIFISDICQAKYTSQGKPESISEEYRIMERRFQN